MLAQEGEHLGVELLVERDAIEAGPVGAELGQGGGLAGRAGGEEGEMGRVRHQPVVGEGSLSFKAATASGITPAPPRSELQSWTGTVTARKSSGPKRKVTGSATTATLRRGSCVRLKGGTPPARSPSQIPPELVPAAQRAATPAKFTCPPTRARPV